jgi:Ca2+-binding EF-hand superfamily protein
MRATILLAAIVLAPALAMAQQPCTSDADSTVDAIYRQVLERPSGAEGNARADQLRSGQTSVREIVRDVAKSPEHLQRFLPANNRDQAVTNMYRHLLGRAPDQAGLNSHLQGRDSMAALVDTFINSQEYQQKYGDDMVPGGNRRYCRDGSSSAQNNNGRIRFQNLDRNGNGVIEREEWNGNRTSFENQDWNGDGVLSGEEVRPGAARGARRAAEINFNPDAPETWTEETFRQMDRNRDNRLTSSEWFHSANYFRRADRDRDGTLSLSEFTSTSTTSGNRDSRFDSLDVNRNGRVERGEWQGSADAFDWLDRNGDNVLNRSEVVGEGSARFDSFTNLDTNRDGTVRPDEWRWSRRLFDQYDTDNDGFLTRQEFAMGGGAPSASR